MLINDLQRFFASASKIVELYYARSTIVTRQDAVKKEGRVQGAVKFDHVTLKRNGTEVLHDINLDIKPGENHRHHGTNRLRQNVAYQPYPALFGCIRRYRLRGRHACRYV